MANVIGGITMSIDGYITGPHDGPGNGLGDNGERLHYWVFGGPWSYGDTPRGDPQGDEGGWLADLQSRLGAVVCGRGTYEAAGHWGERSPWNIPFFIVTHRPEEEPPGGPFTFVSGVEPAVERALQAAEGRDVHVMGGADTIRQALAAGILDELTIIVAPVIMGAGKPLFEGFSQSLDLQQLRVRQSRFATFLDYQVKR